MKKEKWIKLIGILIILFIISNFIPTKYFVMAPGVARELAPIISVEKGYKKETGGSFMLTAVESRRATIWDYLYISLIHPRGYELEAVGEQLPPGMDMEKYINLMGELMEESKLKAQAVGFKQAGYQVEVNGEGALVVEVLANGSAEEKLQEEDVIIGIDGKKVEFATEAVNLIRRHEIGEKVEIKILRDGKEIDFTLTTVEIENNPGKASIGVMITTRNLNYNFPRQVEFTTDNIVGPSAGSMFALEIYNQLTAKDITAGRKIAGTGTISLDGSVGRIDGVEQKILAAAEADAEIFLVPRGNYRQAEKFNDLIKIYAVENITGAIEYLRN